MERPLAVAAAGRLRVFVVKSGVEIIRDNTDKLRDGLALLTGQDVLVGVPADKSHRDGSKPIGNAALAYIHDNGAPEVNVPARPFMVPGIENAQNKIAERMRAAAEAAIDGRPEGVTRNLNAAGLIAQASIRARITEGIPPPLADSTIRGRRYQRGTATMRAGEVKELSRRAAGRDPSVGLVKPLINTGQLRNAITYVIRRFKK